ncbi:cytochrome P450 [Streptomyces scopuliridis]|uniref:Cytochrome P450 n=1 Tax=Streptomyces scopuliridis TaxID=452529 RepID=A0ACD4ZXR2_9ACTN|nr:cytochrome P450 [Streptomyces scopuliridis]WSC02622.1 cytochrome P450 [Streptomyces scopuliridis]WSC03846.1 cytochrome P450 [Streptomyces scopuliridis]
MTVTDHTPILAAPASRGGCPFAPPPAYEQAREEAPVTRVTLWDGSQCWLITRHEDVRAVLGDARFSAEATRPGYPFLSPGRKTVAAGESSFIRMDDPDHARLRRMLTADFMVKKIEAMRPEIQRLTDDLLDRMTASRSAADLVTEFALPLPSLVICRLLGVPYEDHDYFQERSRVLLHNGSTEAEVLAARDELVGYLTELAKAKEHAPDDGIMSRLMARGELGMPQAAAMGLLLLIAGHETTANMTALSVLALLRERDQWTRLQEDPSLVKGAVEELLRYLTIVHNGVTRAATEDVTIGGRTIRAGEGVICTLNTANRDADVFPSGADLDVARDARRHVAFGFGVHQCLGQPLARVELQTALETIIRRLPDLRLDVPFEDIRFREDMVVYGVYALPVAW